VPPSEPVTQQLVAAVVARLQGIRAGSTYWYQPDEVLTEHIGFSDLRGALAYSVLGGNESPAGEDNRDVHEGFEIALHGWAKAHDDEDRLRMARRCVGDLKVAIAVDEGWGGLAVRTSAPAVEMGDPSEETKPFMRFVVRCTIFYDRVRTAA